MGAGRDKNQNGIAIPRFLHAELEESPLCPRQSIILEFAPLNKNPNLAGTFPLRLSAPLVLPANRFKYEIDSSSEAAFKIVRAEPRGNSIAKNLVAGDVGQRPFQPVARLDSHPVIGHENQKDDAIVSSLLPDLPCLESALGKVFDRTLRRHCPPDGDYNLI